MALLDEKTREKYLKELGYKTIKEFQKAVMYPQWVDGVYGSQTDNALRTAYNVHKYCKNFSPREFMCECGGRYCGGYPDYMKPAELKHIQTIRDHYGKPITITSGLRCKEWNRVLNGSVENSGHLRGLALDCYQAGVTDTVANRKAAMRYFMSLPNHKFTYGKDMAGSDGIYRSAAYMGNAMHTECSNTDIQSGKLNVDGIGGGQTVMAIQKHFGLKTIDGIISGQSKDLGKYYTSLIAVEYGVGGSATVKALQKWAGCTADGVWGQGTSKALQQKLNSIGYSVGSYGADGYFGTDSMKALQRFLNGDKPGPVPPTPTGYKVIDVSEHQGKIDWKKVKADGVVGAIIRYAEDDYLDPRFAENMKGAKAAGLHVGAYIYSWAKTKAEAENYAVHLYNACKPYNCDMPLYIDLEKKGYEKYADETAIAFLVKLDKLGCTKRGVYASLSWWNKYLKKTRNDYKSNAFWIAQYYTECQFEPKSDVGMWQYTSEGKVNGINNWVDMDICYVPYWEKKDSVYDKICKWCKQIADGGKYHYVQYTDDEYTHECPICHKRNYDLGWNCIGYAFASWKHGGGIPSKCSCDVLYNGLCDRWVNMSDADVLASAKSRIGISDIKLIRNGNKAIPSSSLRAGDLLLFYNKDDTYQHMGVYVGNGKIADCTNGRSKNIVYGSSYDSYNKSMPCLFAIRYTKGKDYSGTLPSYRLKKTNAQVKADAVKWAKWIAGNNKFHYGYGDESHHNGCFFCGTQSMKQGHGIKEPNYTYCCNPFVGACWAHGGGDAQAYKMCHNYSSWDFGTGGGSYETSPLFDNIGHPAKSNLKAGDVLCNSHHVALYVGDGKIAEAGHEDDNVIGSSSWNSSISVGNLSDKRYSDFPRVYRYNGKVDADRPISHGEVSDRVVLLQKYMIWGGWLAKDEDDGIFGEGTLEAVKEMQKALKVTADGWVGSDTLQAMRAYKK